HPLSRVSQMLLGAVAGSPSADTEQDFKTPGGVEEALAGLAGAAPVLVVLDDLDRAGPASFVFLERLAAMRSPAPVLVVGVSRPGLEGRGSGRSGQPTSG